MTLVLTILILITIVVLYIASVIKVYRTSKAGHKIGTFYLFLFLVPVIGQVIILLSDITGKKAKFQ